MTTKTVDFMRKLPDDWRNAMIGIWYIHPDTDPRMLGFIPAWIDVDEAGKRSMVDMIHQNYGHGGGWIPFEGFKINPLSGEMEYPHDPVTKPLALLRTMDEVLWFYPYSWITVYDIQNETFRTARID